MKQEKKLKSDPPRLFGREVLAETLAESRTKRIEEIISGALEKMGIAAQITDSEERKLVSVFTIVIDGRQRQVAVGNNIVESEDPVSEAQGILRMYGLGMLSK
jgi:hypothetical protein